MQKEQILYLRTCSFFYRETLLEGSKGVLEFHERISVCIHNNMQV